MALCLEVVMPVLWYWGLPKYIFQGLLVKERKLWHIYSTLWLEAKSQQMSHVLGTLIKMFQGSILRRIRMTGGTFFVPRQGSHQDILVLLHCCSILRKDIHGQCFVIERRTDRLIVMFSLTTAIHLGPLNCYIN